MFIFVLFCYVLYSDQVWDMQGSYSLKMRLYDGNKHELTCIAFDFDIGFASSDSSVADS